MSNSDSTACPARIGILGMQGCYQPHVAKLQKLGCEPKRIVYPDDLADVAALILPGGESTTMLKGMTAGLWEALLEFAEQRPIWGICAGSILLACGVKNPHQQSLELIDIDVIRNGYGAQNESFIADLTVALPQREFGFEGIFIRAPIISRAGDDVEVLASHGGNPVMVSSGRHLVTTFHPELSDSVELHRYFMERVNALQVTGNS